MVGGSVRVVHWPIYQLGEGHTYHGEFPHTHIHLGFCRLDDRMPECHQESSRLGCGHICNQPEANDFPNRNRRDFQS